jgi:predicted enzyme related to lactoylglutathione lyase
VKDLDATITQIRERGWEITDKTFGCDNSWQARKTDPGGVQIELMG